MAARQRAPDSLIGRERELIRSRALLRSTRLLTLVGPGGAGKTRIARELAAAHEDAMQFIDLGVLCRADCIPQVITAAMGAGEHGGQEPWEALAAAIGDQRLLMVLDNCEHLIESTAQIVVGLLRHCARVRILVTSREALRVPGEAVLSVGPLSLPVAGQRPDAVTALRTGAIALFLERAQACNPGFEFTADNTAVVTGICRRLDGLPLALELAAHWVSTLEPGEILAGLDDQLTLLSGSGTPGRQSGLRTAFERSYRLLNPAEQAVLRRLSVLLGNFSLDQAATVCGMDTGELRPVLSDLVAKSLVVSTATDSGRPVFRQLNTIRAYGRECLETSGEFGSTWERMTGWLLALAESVLATVILTDDLASHLLAEGDNLIAAVEYTAAWEGDRQVALALALVRYWEMVDQWPAAHALVKKVLANAPDSEYRSYLLTHVSEMTFAQGDSARAIRQAKAAVSAARSQCRPEQVANSLNRLGHFLEACDNPAGAIAAYKECASLLRGLGQRLGAAVMGNQLAWALLAMGRAAEAAQAMAACVPVLWDIAPVRCRHVVLHTIGVIYLMEGEIDAAEAIFADGAVGEAYNLAYQLEGLTIVAVERGNFHRALCLSAAVARMRASIGVEAEPWWRQRVASATAMAGRHLGPAKAGAARSAGHRLRGERLLAFAQAGCRHEWALTERERQIVALVAQGLANHDIAAGLQLSSKTVDAHLDSVRAKLGLRSKPQIAAWAATCVNSENAESHITRLLRISREAGDHSLNSGPDTAPAAGASGKALRTAS